MVYSTESIVLGHINYSETSIIVRCFTKKFGVKSFLIRGIRSKKKKKNTTRSISKTKHNRCGKQ